MVNVERDNSGPAREVFAVSLKELIRALHKRKWWILFSTIVMATAVGGYTMRQKKVYRATARILLDASTPSALSRENVVNPMEDQFGGAAPKFIATQFKIMKSREVMGAAVRNLKLAE